MHHCVWDPLGHKLDYYDVSLEILSVYLSVRPSDQSFRITTTKTTVLWLPTRRSSFAKPRHKHYGQMALCSNIPPNTHFSYHVTCGALQQYPNSATAMNLKACNCFRLCDLSPPISISNSPSKIVPNGRPLICVELFFCRASEQVQRQGWRG